MDWRPIALTVAKFLFVQARCQCSLKLRTLMILAIFGVKVLPAQERSSGDYKITATSDYVFLDVSVTRDHGSFVGNLQRNNFTVLDDGRPVDIRDFLTSDAPVALGLVVDNSGSMVHKRPEVITAGLAFARESNRADEFFVVNFNESVVRGLPPEMPFTDNLRLLHDALYFGRPAGQTALYDAAAYSLKHLELSHLHRRTLIVVSDGRDNASQLRFAELLSRVESSQATIYTIGLYDPNESIDRHVLGKIAKISGGEFFEPKEMSEVGPIFHKISQDIRHRYTIGFVPDEMTDKKQVRTIKVFVKGVESKVNVLTRTRYRTAPVERPEHGYWENRLKLPLANVRGSVSREGQLQ
jgi:Ca-activated chloride channel homolog